MRADLTEVVEKQDVIICLQSGVIDDLFRLLAQHTSAEEAGALPVVPKISKAAALRRELGGDP